MKKRLISLLLAFSMMLTFLPAGAVSAFAEGTADDTTKGELLTDGKTITESGTYQLKGPYTQGITINTEDSVEINVTGNVTGNLPDTSGALIYIKNGTVTFNGNGHTVTSTKVIYNEGGNLTVQGGTYVCQAHDYKADASCFALCSGENRIENVTIETDDEAITVALNCENAVIKKSKITKKYEGWSFGAIQCHAANGNVELDDVEVEAENGHALRFTKGIITINGGTYTAKNGYVIGPTDNENEDLNLTINGGTFQGNDRYTVASFGCYQGYRDRTCNIQIHGGRFVGGQLLAFYGSSAKTLTIDRDTTFESTGSTLDAVVVGNGQLIFDSGTIEVSGGSERSALRTFERGEAIVNGGTFKGAKYDIYERNNDYRVSPDRVQLKNATFDDDVCNVCLEKDLQIDVTQNYTGQVTIECKDPSDGRQLTKATETNYQKDLNLTSANKDYLVGYKKTTDGEYRCLSKKVGVTIEGLENAAIKEGESKGFTVKVDPKGDANLGEAIIDFGDKNSEIEYKDKTGAYQRMPEGGLKIGLGDGEHEFRITPQKAGKQTLTAAVVRDAVEVGTDSKDYTVAGRVHTTVTIEGLEDAVIKEGESEDFTVKVTPNDDAKLGEAVIDFGDKNSEIEYLDDNGAYQPMPEGGLPIDLGDVKEQYAFRITPKETGKQTLTAVVKQDKNELATDEKDFVVSEMPILTLKDGVITSVTVSGKNGADPEDITEIVKKNANEDGSFNVPEGATVSVAFDKDAFADSGLKFGHWDITGLDDPNAYQNKESFAFVMPAKGVTLKAMTQDASIEDDEPDIVGPIVIGTTVVVGGAVLGYQAYSLGAEFAGKLMALPYFPSNRSALAMMLWEDAGKPMPESELLYPDVGQEERDMDLQHAARWAMENDLVPDLNDEGTAPEEMKFYPDNTVSKIDVLNAWQKAQELKQNA